MSTCCDEYADPERSMLELVFAPCSPEAAAQSSGAKNWMACTDKQIFDATMVTLSLSHTHNNSLTHSLFWCDYVNSLSLSLTHTHSHSVAHAQTIFYERTITKCFLISLVIHSMHFLSLAFNHSNT